MTNAGGDPADTLSLILSHLLPLLLGAALSVRSFISRWRLLHSKLTLLQSSLSDAAASPHWPDNPLFVDLLSPLLASLRSLHALSSRCLDPALPSGKLHLQSDLDIAASSLALHLHDLDLLLRSGLLHHPLPTAPIVLPLPGPSASRADLALFLRDLFARLQIGALDLKLKALDSLLRLLSSDAPKLAPLVVQESDHLPALLRLLDPSAHSLIRDQAAAAVSLLCTSSDASRRAVFEEGGLGALLRLLETTGSAAVRERAASAVEAITADSSNAWAVSAYGGVPILIEACRSGGGSPAVRAIAAGALKNVSSSVDDLRDAMVEEGAVPALVDLLSTGTCKAQKNAALCLWSLASLGREEIRITIVQQGGLQRLLQLLREASDTEVMEDALRAIQALSASPSAARVLSASLGFFIQLADLINCGTAATQLVAACLLCSLSPSEGIRRLIGGCMGALVKMLESSKPATAQEAAAGALVMLLEVRSNRKDFGRDEKSLMRLVRMLDPRREEVCKKFPVSVVVALLAGGGGCRKRMAEADAVQHLQKLGDAEVPGAKKAVQLMNGGGRLKRLFSISWRE